MAEEKKEDQPGADKKEKKGRKGFLKWGIVSAGVVTLFILGFLGWQILLPRVLPDRKATPEQGKVELATKNQSAASGLGYIYPLHEFIVNLAEPSGDRFLKAKIELELADEKVGEEINRRLPQIRDAILLILTTKGFQDMCTIDGKLRLKNEILSRMTPVLGAEKVRAVYFTDFVIQ